MNNDIVTVRNILNRGVTKVRRRIAEHEKFGKCLEIVPDGTNPFVPLHKLVKAARPEPLAPSKVEVKNNDLEEEED